MHRGRGGPTVQPTRRERERGREGEIEREREGRERGKREREQCYAKNVCLGLVTEQGAVLPPFNVTDPHNS